MLDVFLNYACQAKCPFCFNPPLTPELIRWKLPLERLAAELIKQHAQGYRGVAYSGGEVTLLRELPKMLRLSRRAGYDPIGIVSNGLRLAEKSYARELVDAGLSFCCISIHAPHSELHDELLVVPGAFKKALAAMAHLRALDIPVLLNYVLTRRNAAELPAFLTRFAAEPGVAGFQVFFPHYEGLMEVHAEELRLSYTEAAPHVRKAASLARELGAAEKLAFFDIPPCIAPELLPHLREWEREDTCLLVDPKGVTQGGFFSERRDRLKNEQCKRCSLDDRCLGFESAYVRRFGLGEAKSVNPARNSSASRQPGRMVKARRASSPAAPARPTAA